MSRIKILPESLANQIAAGEVVERPASVVKELLENAIDAGASSIEIHVEGAGTRSIRIIDNGTGMDEDDMLLSLERHATSKLACAEQLSTIATLGFRGEAIPSIASVSKVTLTSRLSSAELGSSVYVHFGTIKKVHEMGCATGTMIEVRDLFGNVPARRKFLKAKQTELAHIDEVVRSYCLANPHIGFDYQVEGKNVLRLSANSDSSRARFQALIGSGVDLIGLEEGASEGAPIKVRGFLVPPEQASGKSAKLWTFVNGRFVKDRLVSHAVYAGLQGFLMKGKRPGGLVFVELAPQEVDVNVHPTKQEVRFRNSGQVHQAIATAVASGLQSYQQDLRAAVFSVPERKVEPAMPSGPEPSGQGATSAAAPEPPLYSVKVTEQAALNDTKRAGSIFNKPLFPQTTLKERVAPYRPELQTVPSDHADGSCQDETPGPDTLAAAAETQCQPAMKPIGQLFDTYILCETAGGLVVVDQHAAQERLLYEELKAQYLKSAVPSQTLLFPEMVDLTAAEVTIVEQFAAEIQRLGLDIKPFGGDSYVVNAIPASMTPLSGEEVLRDVLDRFQSDDDGRQSESRLDRVLSVMACKASIKAGHTLESEEIQSLLEQMQRAGVFSHCPHGRPVVKKFSVNDVKKWFYRS